MPALRLKETREPFVLANYEEVYEKQIQNTLLSDAVSVGFARGQTLCPP